MKELAIISGSVSVDNRGFIRYVNEFSFDNVKRFYQVGNHNINFVRGWYGHDKEDLHVYVPRGTANFGVVDMSDEEQKRTYVLSEQRPRILHIPPGYWRAFKMLEQYTCVIFFSNLTLKESQHGLKRKQWNEWNVWSV
jgi:dTDP-4-dehydrorhamnose 3,5-epimerase